jgi:hypothetical protein
VITCECGQEFDALQHVDFVEVERDEWREAIVCPTCRAVRLTYPARIFAPGEGDW